MVVGAWVVVGAVVVGACVVVGAVVVVVVGASVVVDGVVADSVDDGDSLLGDWVSVVADDGAWLSVPGAEVPGAGVVLTPGAERSVRRRRYGAWRSSRRR